MPGVVTVACKIPNGIVLQLEKPETKTEPVLGGGERDTVRWTRVGKQIVIKGPAHPINRPPLAPISNGYALTHNVDADFFAEWMKQKADTAIVTERLIFAHEKLPSVDAMTRENERVRSGLEPIDPDNGDARVPKGIKKDTRT
jgi:hypothetical protein